jgi:serine/threonine protein kinase
VYTKCTSVNFNKANNGHIVQLQGVLINDKDQPVGIVTEFLEGGDLEQLIHPEGLSKTVTREEKINYGIDICKGMGWLAGKEVHH